MHYAETLQNLYFKDFNLFQKVGLKSHLFNQTSDFENGEIFLKFVKQTKLAILIKCGLHDVSYLDAVQTLSI